MNFPLQILIASEALGSASLVADAEFPHDLSIQQDLNRIALSHDRIRRMIRAPGGFEAEHDPESGDLYLRPMAPEEPEATDRAPVILFLGTEKGFTYGSYGWSG